MLYGFFIFRCKTKTTFCSRKVFSTSLFDELSAIFGSIFYMLLLSIAEIFFLLIVIEKGFQSIKVSHDSVFNLLIVGYAKLTPFQLTALSKQCSVFRFVCRLQRLTGIDHIHTFRIPSRIHHTLSYRVLLRTQHNWNPAPIVSGPNGIHLHNQG